MQNRAAPILIGWRSTVRPRMNLKFPRAFRSPVSEQISRPPAFEIPATPDAGLLQAFNFQGAIDPAATSPARRAHVPIGMVIERNENKWIGQSPNPERTEMMKITGTVNEKWRNLRTELAIEFLDQARRRRKAQSRSPFPRVIDRQVARQIRPGIVEVEVQIRNPLCAHFAGRKRS